MAFRWQSFAFWRTPQSGDEGRSETADLAGGVPLTDYADWRDPVLIGILILCAIPEVLLSGADWGLWGHPWWRMWTIQNAGFWSGLLHNWRPNYSLQPYTMFLTYGFLHAGIVHLGVNMVTLFSLGPPLTERFGSARFALLYALSTVGGAACFALLSALPVPMVGASGALFGLAGAHVGLNYRIRRESHESLRPIVRAVAGLAVLNLVLWWAMNGELAWQTHLGGFIVGWIVALWLDDGT